MGALVSVDTRQRLLRSKDLFTFASCCGPSRCGGACGWTSNHNGFFEFNREHRFPGLQNITQSILLMRLSAAERFYRVDEFAAPEA